ncbi:hypothetical protein CC1G_09856 [Coprinopsis cinerea okayama7|uniref:Protein SMG7 n=1 Tax=Coprinopsis cinerea (strain Okayama-7 / 130 / ATCC MYA-4618 / FGSC 9003) TaxID=240176 RepID=A8P0E8_COPC7|nr:hypothetical protein CC1G_09856 [Coprinopsis cinerea okayama7\|eukprot:XP_001837874.2 hypothetical protein CC1G_09856 [Coprinopsis cinerea okayama7\
MSEQPITIAREAKNIYQSLKELLKTKEPFDKELEFQRKNLRKRYLSLLLLHPYAKESKDVENHLWMQTSYASISSYKERIAIIDRAIQAHARQPQGQPGQQRQQRHGPVEHRKLLSRFRQFLAEEEKFWIHLLLRMYRSFGLEEARPALTALGLLHDNQDLGEAEGQDPPHSRTSFPEEPETSVFPSNPAERESRLAILSKALICLGDIARYRELYNEGGGRPRAGHEGGRPARRGRRGGPPETIVAQPRVYDNAQQRYEQARLLVPNEGNPFHQLAILATYRKDTFASVYYYYRALSVRQPYETAGDNLATVLQKASDQWRRTRKERERMLSSGPLDIKDRVMLFKERTVVLHSLWRKGIDKIDSKFKEHDKTVYQDFYELVAERHLPIDMISHAIVLSQGALWKHKMIRDGRRQEARPVEPSVTTEWRILRHLMDMHFALLEVGRDQLKDLPSMDKVDNDLAQRITAIFRRTLPALRIASKWLRANFAYVMTDLEFQAYQEKEKLRSVAVEKKCPEKISAHSVHSIRFWKGYAQFVAALSQAFPTNRLPSLTAPLEEDVDLRGFLPLKKLMVDAKNSASDVVNGNGNVVESPHPNEEQLMRISDLLADAQALVEAKNSPLTLINQLIVFDDSMVEPRTSTISEPAKPLEPIASRQQQIMNQIRDKSAEVPCLREEDVMTEGTSRTDDDVLKAAFQHIGGDAPDVPDDDDDEIVLFNPKASLSPALSPLLQTTPITPVRPLNGSAAAKAFPSPPLAHNKPSPLIGKTPISSPRVSTIHATTAQDLLQDVMNVGRKPGSGLVPPSTVDPSGIQPPLLFGSELSHRPSLISSNAPSSIWSAGHDEQGLKFGSTTSPGHSHNHANPHHSLSPRLNYAHSVSGPAQDLTTPSIWAPSHTSSIQSPQLHLGGSLPSGTSQPHQPNNAGVIGSGLHHRLPSASHTMAYSGSLSPHRVEQQRHQYTFSHSSSTSSVNVPKPHHQSFYSADLRNNLGPGGGLGGTSLSSPSLGNYYHQPQSQQSTSTNGHSQGLGHLDPFARLGLYPPLSQTHSQPPPSLQSHTHGNGLTSPQSLSHLWGNVG